MLEIAYSSKEDFLYVVTDIIIIVACIKCASLKMSHILFEKSSLQNFLTKHIHANEGYFTYNHKKYS